MAMGETISLSAKVQAKGKEKKSEYPFIPKEITKKDKKDKGKAEGRTIVGMFGLVPSAAVGLGVIVLVLLAVAYVVRKKTAGKEKPIATEGEEEEMAEAN